MALRCALACVSAGLGSIGDVVALIAAWATV
jgi:hypothetical protein